MLRLAGVQILLCIYSRWSLDLFLEMETCIVGVERVAQFIALPAEDELLPGNNRLEKVVKSSDKGKEVEEKDEIFKDWLRFGSVWFNNVTLKYKEDLPPALNNLSFRIKGGERIGLCGESRDFQSGELPSEQVLYTKDAPVPVKALSLPRYSGTLISVGGLSMVRFHSPSPPIQASQTCRVTDRDLMAVDGQDISTIPRAALRDSLSIIPQGRSAGDSHLFPRRLPS